MIQTLQSLRGLFALMIFFHHFMWNGASMFPAGGDCGVNFFIVLSGFVLSAGYNARISTPRISTAGISIPEFRYGKFAWKRIARLYPIHILCLLIYLLLSFNAIRDFSNEKWMALASNLFLLQSWIPSKEFFFSGNPVSWCLADILFLSLIFPLLSRMANRVGNRRFAMIVLTITIAYVALLPSASEYFDVKYLYVVPLLRIPDFLIGMLLWKMWEGIKDSSSCSRLRDATTAVKTAIEVGAVAILLIWIALWPAIPVVYQQDAWWLIPSSLIILLFTALDGHGGIFSRILGNRYLIHFGYASFSFYLIHKEVDYVVTHALKSYDNGIAQALPLAASLMISIAAALILYKYYEKPIAALFLRHAKK